jgi:hypothetical protein
MQFTNDQPNCLKDLMSQLQFSDGFYSKIVLEKIFLHILGDTLLRYYKTLVCPRNIVLKYLYTEWTISCLTQKRWPDACRVG